VGFVIRLENGRLAGDAVYCQQHLRDYASWAWLGVAQRGVSHFGCKPTELRVGQAIGALKEGGLQVLLCNTLEDRMIGVSVGRAHRGAFLSSVFGVKSSRPLTHELFAEVVRVLGAEITGTVLRPARETGIPRGLAGGIEIQRGDMPYCVPAGVGDAIVVAVALNVPIRYQPN